MKGLLLLLLGLFVAGSAFSQAPQRCGTDANHAALQQDHPALRTLESKQLRDYVAYMDAGAPRSSATYLIPVVVHVIQPSPAPLISDATIRSQIDVLNEDFRRLNADTNNTPLDFQAVAGDTDIEFCLATIDPNGCATDGIVRVVSPLSIHDSDDSADLKALSQWDPYRYLNIWLVENIADNILGYATLPSSLSFAPQLDGVVIDATYFGRGPGVPSTSYNLGRTGTHEVGHWLGLNHTFGGPPCAGNAANTCLLAGDNICDTPPTSGSSFGCPGVRNTCTETPVDMNDQTMNYMDYVDDACMNMFSLGQGDRMRFFLDNVRSQIWSSGNLTSTGCDGTVSPGCSPTAAFDLYSRVVCAGDTVRFMDLSVGPPSSYAWTFTQGNFTSTDTAASPTVVFPTSGPVNVELTVTNAFGSDTRQETAYFTVESPRLPPLTENFELTAGLPGDWIVEDLDMSGTWQYSDQAASDGAASLFVENYQGIYTGYPDNLVSPVLDLENGLSGSLIWDYAYKRYDSFRRDSLFVDVSSDCGQTWTNEWLRFGNGLTTVGGVAISNNFVPTAGQWASDTIDLGPYMSASKVRVRFRVIGLGGQDIYLDHIRTDILVGRDEAQSNVQSWSVTSPLEASLRLWLELKQSDRLTVALMDGQGRTVWQKENVPGRIGGQELSFEDREIGELSGGIYFVRVSGKKTRGIRKVLKF